MQTVTELDLNKLTHFSAAEKDLVKRLVRPVDMDVESNFETEQFNAFLCTLNGQYEAMRGPQKGTVQRLRTSRSRRRQKQELREVA